MVQNLDDHNFMNYAIEWYEGIVDDEQEFLEDLSRIVYVKRLLNKFSRTGELKERLVLNHIVILHNVFGPNASRMLFLKIPEYHSELKTLLNYLSRMPDHIPAVNGVDINTGDIPIHFMIAQKLQDLE